MCLISSLVALLRQVLLVWYAYTTGIEQGVLQLHSNINKRCAPTKKHKNQEQQKLQQKKICSSKQSCRPYILRCALSFRTLEATWIWAPFPKIRVTAVVHSLEAPQSTWSAATQTDRSFSASPTSLESARAKKLEQRCNGLNCIWIETLAIPF